MNVNVNFMEQNVTQVNSGIMINVDVTVKKHNICEKKIFGILVHVFVKIFTKYYGRFSDYV